MQTVLIVVHLIIVLALIGVVLLQRSEGGLGLGGGGGGGVAGFMTGRGQANALTRATAILAALFFATSLLLAVMSHRAQAPKSILDTGAPQAGQPAKQPTGADNLLDTLRQQQDRAPATAPAQPSQPAPAQPAPTQPAPAQPGVPDAPQSR
ncbi:MULTISPECIES: preprotein translocase subunit SecG [unclassified Methylobacterium]|uniref:preprotein translocase subunit SecG n=1 Tax=unclassified Methylobacterium TaxID=2615210 RepID=UPI001FBBF8B4|nr:MULTISPECIES: preprotein translocase subunit SecG [unclassified Methylobacterium]MCJ2019693.1 preprotein translocase subunit SecG [Methylobacterium sp. E-065]